MYLAGFEIWHSRPFAPTRRLALGEIDLPMDPAPGLGGLLLAAVVSAHFRNVDEDLVPDIHRLVAGNTWRENCAATVTTPISGRSTWARPQHAQHSWRR